VEINGAIRVHEYKACAFSSHMDSGVSVNAKSPRTDLVLRYKIAMGIINVGDAVGEKE